MSNGTTNGSSSNWDVLAEAMGKSVDSLQQSLIDDSWWKAFVTSDAIIDAVTMGVQSAGDGDAILVAVEPGAKTTVTTGPASKADFTLVATGEQWRQFFEPEPKAPFTSFVGLQGMNIKQEGVGTKGDQVKFSQNAHLATRLLEKLREGMHGPIREEEAPDTDEDHILGRYIYINPPLWGRCKTFTHGAALVHLTFDIDVKPHGYTQGPGVLPVYCIAPDNIIGLCRPLDKSFVTIGTEWMRRTPEVETAGDGPQEVVFCHTAGSDSRQYHGVMNDSRMREKFTMYAFDLPAHGRSFPYKNFVPGGHTNTEDAYIGAIAEVIKVLKLNKPILCGASMAGQVCVAAAIRSDEVGVKGTVPLQGCDYLTMDRQWYDKSPTVNQALFNADWIYGMMNPHSPAANKLLIWHTYSAQGYGIFHGDLDFYFGGFDARDRVHKIDVSKCPIYFLTGEYDWSTTPDMAAATAKKIKGAKAVPMKGLGHFPATENPGIFVPYFLEAAEWIQQTYKG